MNPLPMFVLASFLGAPQGAPPASPVLPQRVQAWRAEHGEGWEYVLDRETRFARLIHGISAAPAVPPRTDAEVFALARAWILESAALHGIELETLADDGVVFLPLGALGSGDKLTARFRQEVRGVRVLGGAASVLLSLDGRLLSIDATGLPRAAALDVDPSIEAAEALATAQAFFRAEAGRDGALVRPVALAIEQVADPATGGKLRTGRLVWEVELFDAPREAEPIGWVFRLDARDGSLSSRSPAVHYFDVSGTVQTRATPGVLPDKASNPAQVQPAAHLVVQSAQGNAETDGAGAFTIPGASAPLQVTLTYVGPFARVDNQAGAPYSLASTLSAAAGNTVTMNSPAAALVTAQANAFQWINALRDWTRAVNPADATADFQALAKVNEASTCNAYFGGGSVNFFQAGGGCVNTAYSTVVLHEMGHWLNVLYGSGNGGDGFGEGNADAFAMYVVDHPIVGMDFCGTGCHVRTGLNNRPFCGDQNPACHGEVHADGEVLMGALWKVRARLKTALGTPAGGAAANALFNAWMNAYDDGQIKTIVETHWLVLDDDDGSLANGTPHFAHIDGGFRDQSFPGYALPSVAITGVTDLPDTEDEGGPYVVDAKMVANFAPPVLAPQLFYSVNGSAFSALPMSALGGDQYRAAIPGQVSPAEVEYYLQSTDALGAVAKHPVEGAQKPLRFVVGVEQVFFFEDFESLSAGWTYGTYAGASDWNTGYPKGKAGDPSAPFSGSWAWGTDLGYLSGDGAYSHGSSTWLRSPVLDLSNAVNPRLRFRRWLTVEDGQSDQAQVLVNGVEVWANPVGSDLLDTSWVDLEVPIGSLATGNPSVQIEWRLSSDGSVAFGGWNVDAVEVATLGASGSTCVDPAPYCTAKTTSLGTTPQIGWQGLASVTIDQFEVDLFDAVPEKPGVVFYGTAPNAQAFQGGILCVKPPAVRGPTFQTDAFGYAHAHFPLAPPMAGQELYLQVWFRDPTDPFTIGLSDALHVHVCP